MLATAQAAAPAAASSPDDALRAVAEDHPAFGGAWVAGDAVAGEAEQLHVWLINGDTDALVSIRSALVERLGKRFSVDDVVVHDADYNFVDLHRWNQLATGALGQHGINYVDIDETANRLHVGIDTKSGDQPAASDELTRRGVPKAAVEWSASGAVHPLPADTGTPANGALVTGVVAAAVAAFVLVARARRTRGFASEPLQSLASAPHERR